MLFRSGYGSEVSSKLSDGELEDCVAVVSKSKYRIAKPRLLCRTVVDQLERLRQQRAPKSPQEVVAEIAPTLLKEDE